MASGEDWLLRPVKEGFCKYESLVDGTLALVDIKRMNDFIDVQNENEARYYEAQNNGKH